MDPASRPSSMSVVPAIRLASANLRISSMFCVLVSCRGAEVCVWGGGAVGGGEWCATAIHYSHARRKDVGEGAGTYGHSRRLFRTF